MDLKSLGYYLALDEYRIQNNLKDIDVARVVSEHKERYLVKNPLGEFEAEILGNMRFTAKERSDFPAVGDWVSILVYDNDKAIIHHILPRKNKLERTAVGKTTEKQIIACNIDFAMILMAVDRDYNLNRIERYLTICYESKITPIIILNKVDLKAPGELEKLKKEINNRFKEIQFFGLSNISGQGIEELKSFIEEGRTYCLLGSSGVGKTTLINTLSGHGELRTGEISAYAERGKHVTTHRELFILPGGGILIDNPGMREVGISNSKSGLSETFAKLYQYAANCKYTDCTHTHESGCAVVEALKNGIVDPEEYDNYIRLSKEEAHYSATLAEKRQNDKQFGKMVKQFKKAKKKLK